MLDLAQRLTKVETIVKIGFPALAGYITLLKVVPAVDAPVKALSALIQFIA